MLEVGSGIYDPTRFWPETLPDRIWACLMGEDFTVTSPWLLLSLTLKTQSFSVFFKSDPSLYLFTRVLSSVWFR